ncbi:MAG TPA: hypothetical protein VJG83_05370 [archaeon]|nr:hypothetical protein [archaeon]
MRVTEVCLPLLILGLLLSTPITQAANNEPITVNVGIDLQPLINAVNIGTQGIQGIVSTTSGTINDTLEGISKKIFELFKDSAKNATKVFIKEMLSFTLFLISTNPDVDLMHNLWQSITIVISSFYLIIFILIGAKFLLSGHSIEGREQAKDWLKKAFMMVIGVNASFLFYKLILETSTAITQFIWITGFENFFDESIFSGTGFIILAISAGSIGLALITLFLRYVFLMLAVLLFPIGIFLYYSPNLQNWGKIIFNLIGMALFMQFIDVIIFIASNQIMQNLAGQAGQAFVPALSFTLIAIVNILMVVYAILKSAFSIADQSPILGYALGAITGQISTIVKAATTPPTPRARG